MKRRSFIQGLAAVFGAGAAIEKVNAGDFVKAHTNEEMNDFVYDISPVDNPYLSYSDPDQLHEQRARLRKLRYEWKTDKL